MSKSAALALACVASACGKGDERAATITRAAGPVDACALMPRDQVEARLGELDGASHSIAGEVPIIATCRLRLADNLQATLTVRSLTDYDAMAESGTQLAGLGEQAMQTQSGVMLKVAGRPHFFQVVVTGPRGLEIEKSIELAKVVAATAK